ncbi:purine-cytosine permease family protein [Streptomyces sp. cg40]|uniref:purine-cytosine permease family protein n=1 Tax=Streptomyces sp. cg40 TaxID=3419764 RepID=UPI003CFEC9E1
MHESGTPLSSSAPRADRPPPSPDAERTWSPERRSVEFVPHQARYGRSRSLFTLWFGANMQVTTIAAGALNVSIGLSLGWALLSVLVGNLTGAVFMALHSAQGPRLGIPQMIQSRAQFGYVGAILPLVLVLLMYLGFFATTGVQGGQALAGWSGMPASPAMILVSTAILIAAIFGYRLIHAMQKWVSLLSCIAFAYLTVRLLTAGDLAAAWQHQHVTAGSFLLGTALAATWQITYAPYVADYSRYLPQHTSIKSTYWYTYAGSVLASCWMMAFGVLAAAVAPSSFDGGSVEFIVHQSQGDYGVFYAVILLGIVGINSLNLYGIFMATTSIVTALTPLRVGPRSRALIITLAASAGTTVGLSASSDFLGNFLNFILLLAYFLIPWTAINLADFYLVRKETYDIPSIFDPAGRYQGVDLRTATAYAVGVATELPFVNSGFYVGPLVAPLGGADISWCIGLVTSGAAYVFLMRRFTRAGDGKLMAATSSN